MKPGKLISAVYLVVVPSTVIAHENAGNNMASYVIGGVIVLLFLAYLICSLLKLDKYLYHDTDF